jgi:hypothetical protein
MEVLIIRVNKPKVNRFIGMVRKSNRGFKKMFNNPKIIAVIKAVKRLPTSIPDKR